MRTRTEFTDILRRHGLKATGQRLAIMQALAEHGHHATVEEIYGRVREVLPSVSLTTVYKVLHELVALGEVRRVQFGDDSYRFDPNTEPHAHLVCTGCGQALDLPATDYCVGLPTIATRGFRVSDHALVFYGLCPACQATNRRPVSRSEEQ